MAELTLGQRVRVTATLHRTCPGGETVRATTRKEWLTIETPEPFDGVVVGARTYYNGLAHWGSYDDPGWWQVESSLPVILVATHLRQTAIPCPPEHVHPADPAPEPPAEPDGPHLLTLLEEDPDA